MVGDALPRRPGYGWSRSAGLGTVRPHRRLRGWQAWAGTWRSWWRCWASRRTPSTDRDVVVRIKVHGDRPNDSPMLSAWCSTTTTAGHV